MWFSRTGEIFWILFLSFNQVFLVQGNEICEKTFRQSDTTSTFSIICPEECIKWRFINSDVVFGTRVYHPDSLICLSALHAGVARIGAPTPLKFTQTATRETFVGTVSNRVISGNKGADIGFQFENKRFVQTDRTDELVMVHNNNQQSRRTDAYVTCLPNNQETLRRSSAKPNITRWNYREQKHDEVFEDSEHASIYGLRIIPNRGTRVLRCMGSNIEMDITAILGNVNDQFEAIYPTVTTSLQESVKLQYYDRSSYVISPIRLPPSPISGTVQGSNIEITNVSLSDQGLYNSHSHSDGKYQAYSRLIVRGCKKGRSGANCSGWCRDCLNNGECDSDTGECVCSSGTRGKNCQNFCPANKFGAECHLDCERIHSLWKRDRSVTCKGLMFCLRDPKGCSCQPGFKPPRCNAECDVWNYGPDCLSNCYYCNGGTCDSYGRCNQRCENENLCNEGKAPLNLPRFRKPPRITQCDVRGCAVTFSEWDSDYDDGELSDTDGELRYEISIEDLSTPSENANIATYPGQRREFSYDFFRGNSYKIKLNILTNRGKATEEYNMRIQSHHLTLPCLDTYSSADYNVTNIGQTSVTVEWVHRNGPLCPRVRYSLLVMDGANTLLNTYSDLPAITIHPLTADTFYQITLDGKTKTVSTLPYPPASPDNIRKNVTSDRTLIVWNEVKDSSNYEVTKEFVHYIGCEDMISPTVTTVNVTDTEVILDYNNHLWYSAKYKVCVVGVNRGGKSAPTCLTFSTPPNEVPDIEWRELSCSPTSQYKSLQCTIEIASECQKFHGPNITSVWIIKKLSKCPNATPYEDIIEEKFTYSSALWKDIWSLEDYTEYSIRVYLENSIGQSMSTEGVFSTKEAESPAVVQDLTVSGATNNSLFLEWLIPCPSLASIQSYKLSYRNKNSWQIKTVYPTSLCESSVGYICYQLGNLNFNVNYRLKVQSCKSSDARLCSDDSETVIGLTTPTAPGKPTLMHMNALNVIDVVVTTSQYLGEQPSCWTSLHKESVLQQNSSKHPVIPQKEYTFTFTGLSPSSKYLVKSGCCNVKACSSVAETATNTKLAEPVITDEFLSGTITNTTIVIKIPIIESGDSSINVVFIVVRGYGEERMNFTDLYDEYNRARMRKKRSEEENSGTKSYVAGNVENEREFTVGSGDPPSNPPLVRGEVYSVIPVIVLKLNNDRLLVEEPKITFTAGGSLYQPSQYLWIVFITVIIAIVIASLLIGLFVYRSKRKVKRKPENTNGTQNNESESTLEEKTSPNENEKLQLQPLPKSTKDNSVIDSLQKLPTNEAVAEQPIYENGILMEAIDDEAVSIMNMEGYLHSQINSYGSIEKFLEIPKCYPKSTSDGESNENRKKNRYKNNLPYDDTRVKLRIQGGDPSSDYINANHITSVSKNRRYIASQGPKDNNVSTIGDFWRMIIEQEVNVIIMVANFVEKGIVKVGEYVCPESPLQIQSPEGVITVVKREIKSFCTISTVQVQIQQGENSVQREVTHYHFTLWPDHGVPSEPRTLSQMILHIATNHDSIHAVVHCSAGIGRTGTVLFCLICFDYFLTKMPLDIFKVIRQLRSDRGRLIENQVQFKLCLNLLDEMLFGTKSSFPVSEITEKLQTSQKECLVNYQRLARLPNSLICSTASHPDNLSHNRNHQYLAPDSHRVYIQGSNGEMIYINAVKFQGLEIGVEYIATQHPFKNDLDKFWNLVHANRPSKIVVLNKEFDENFPEIYPSSADSSFEVNSNVIKCTSRNSLSPNLIMSEISVDSRKKGFHKMNVYEVQNWERGDPHPRDLSEPVRVAEILLSQKNATPPLFVCGDGVTACGLMIGIINTIDRLKVFQDIDVYRTAVMLRRSHPNVIVDQGQLQQMMEAAEVYTKDFSDYYNFQ